MPSTYSQSLRLELIGDGEQSGTWGQTTNTNLGTLLEQAITGVRAISLPDANYTLTSLNGTSDEARNAVLVFGGSLTATRNIIVPSANKLYTVVNNTNQTLLIKTAAGTGINVPSGYQTFVFCDGTNVVAQAVSFPSSVKSTGGFIGDLTGTASNATNAVNATNATNATSATNATNATNLVGGAMACNAASITSSAPTMWFYDTDAADFAVHVNGNQWYVLNQSGSGILYTDQSGNFTAAGNVTAYSDARLKDNIKTIDNALAKVQLMRGVTFDKDGQRGMGVIAQEMQVIAPEVVQDNVDGYKSVAYGNLVGVLIEAIKELSAEVKALKGE